MHFHSNKFKFLNTRSPSQLLATGFIMLIFFGAILLSLPISTRNGTSVPFLDALFTSTSAICVTGLAVMDTNTCWTPFGQVVILFLIQTGALGIMSVVTLYSVLTSRQIGLIGRLAIKESISHDNMHDIVGLFLRILLFTFSIEAAGALVLSFILVPEYGLSAGIGKSIFHSISAFCNAGFDLFGTELHPFVSLSVYRTHPVMLLTTAVLIITGGLGFTVWHDIAVHRRLNRLSFHSRIVLLMTAILLGTGTVGFLLLERNSTMADLRYPDLLTNAFFQSVTARTAGFNALTVSEMRDASNLLTIALMFIGAAPGSTGGGIKVTTVFVLMASILAFIRARTDVHAFKWRIAMDIIMRSLVIFLLGTAIVFLASLVLMAENDGSFLSCLYESVSAFGTVGLSTGMTPHLKGLGKITLILTMLFGRIGPITAFMAFAATQEHAGISFRYPEGKITVG